MAAALAAAAWLTAGPGAAAQNASLLLKPDAPEFTRPAPDTCVVRFDTTRGTVDIRVTRKWAPLGADRFVNLVRYGYYDGNRRTIPLDGCSLCNLPGIGADLALLLPSP